MGRTLTSSSSLLGTGTVTAQGYFTDFGTVNIGTLNTNGETTFGATAHIGTLNILSGNIEGYQLVVTNSLNWNGDIANTNVVFSSGTLPNTATGTITNAILSGTFENDGSITSTATAFESYGSTFTNNGHFTANTTVPSLYESNQITGAFTFKNNGTFVKQGTGTLEFLTNATSSTLAFNNSGLLQIQGGTLEFSSAVGTTVTNSGIIDLDGGTLKLDAGLSSTSIRAQLLSGLNHGAWNGTGIISSLAASDPNHATGVGYTISGSAYTLMDTWLGDTNLDGVVNAADLANMAPVGTTNATWQQGDFNYDGIVNADDYTLFMLGDEDQTGTFPAVPEPFGLALCAPAISLLFRRK